MWDLFGHSYRYQHKCDIIAPDGPSQELEPLGWYNFAMVGFFRYTSECSL